MAIAGARPYVTILLSHQLEALQHPEAVLLVNNYEAKFGELNFLLDESMSTNHQLCIALSDVAPGFALAIVFEGSGEQNDAIPRRLKNATRGEVMLLRQNFGGRHERDLMSALDGDNCCFECNQSLA